MYLSYPGKKTSQDILSASSSVFSETWDNTPNKLIMGDNLQVLNALIDRCGLRAKVDLVYIDPPYATNNTFTIGNKRANSISRKNSDRIAYSDTLKGCEYIEFLRKRLILLRELMSEKASIYLHIDYKIGHYVKIIMDEVFGMENFRNDIARIKCNPKNFQRNAFGNIKDMVLFYTKSKNSTWNDPKDELTDATKSRLYKKVDKNGRYYTTVPLHAPGETRNGDTGMPWRGILPPEGRHWRSSPKQLEELDKAGLIEWSKNDVPRKIIFADESSGKKTQDIWEFKDAQHPSYPTEKNLDMLKMIIAASSNPNDLVLDCFCGSGTTLVAAQIMGRRWIGVDESSEAIGIAKDRLLKSCSGNLNYQFIRAE